MIGRTIDRYKITAKIGEGGMGSVWRAEDPLLGRTVAIKFLPEELSRQKDARKRFLREARAASVLNHPGIATVYDAGEIDGQVYIVFLLVDGQTIHEHVASQPISVDKALQMTVAACEALDHAHSKGILHRDVTSGNIMITKTGEVVVVDFGLALPEDASRVTRTGVAVGTAAFMAPEVFLGESADKRSDLYGLGVVFYEMLTGQLPFVADRQEALLYMAVHESPLPPSTHNNEIPEAVDRVALRALAKEPGQRYQTAKEFADDLQALQKGDYDSILTADTESTTPPTERARRSAAPGQTKRRTRTFVRIFALAAAGLLLTLAWFLDKRDLLPFGGPTYASVAVLPLQNMSADPAATHWLSQGISQSLVTKLTQLGELRVAPWFNSVRFTGIDKPLNEIANDLHVDALITGELQVTEESIEGTVSLIDGKTGHQIWTEVFAEPRSALFEIQQRVAVGAAKRLKGRITGKEQEELSAPEAESVSALEAYYKGATALRLQTDTSDQYLYSPPQSYQALAYFEKAVEIDPNLSDAYVGIGAIHSNRFYHGSDVADLETAEFNFRQALRIDPYSTGAKRGLIRVYWHKGLSEECLKVGKQTALEGGKGIESLAVRADAYVFGGLPKRAIPVLAQIIELDPGNRDAHWLLVVACAWSGKHDDVIDAGEDFLDRFGEDGEVLRWMGYSYQMRGELDVARIYLERIGDGFGLARLYEQLGEGEKAVEIYRRMLDGNRRKLGAHPDNYRTRASYAALNGALGNRDVLWQEEQLLLDGARLGEEFFEVALAHLRVGEPERTLELLALAAQTGADNLAYLEAHTDFPKLKDVPGYDECYSELRKLHDRLRAQY